MQFTKATKKRAKARIALDGPSGSGKTYSALIAATVLANGGKIAVIDTERGSASLYADRFNFDVLELDTFSPALYVQAIKSAESAGYNVIVIDSLSHAWEGEGGALEMVDNAAKRVQGNSWAAWRDVTPLHRKLVDTMLQSPAHVIATMRSKMDYVQEKDEKGRTVIRKVGMAPVQRQGMEYEFTIVGDMDIDHNLMITKSRCEILADKVQLKPDASFWKPFMDWLNSGDEYEAPKQSAHVLDGQPEPYDAPKNTAVMPPSQLIEHLRSESKRLHSKYQDADPSPEQSKALVAAMNQVAGGDSDRRHTFYSQVYPPAKSNNDLSKRQTVALLNWINSTQDENGEWYIGNQNAVEEFNRVVTAAIGEHAVGDLFGEEEQNDVG